MSAFEELGVCPELITSASDAGWLLPTAVQAESMPLILGGGDVLVAAETGSGKTGAFGVPVLQIVHESLRGTALVRVTGNGDGSDTKPKATTAAECLMSATDRDAQFAVSPSGTKVQARDDKAWAGGRATTGVTAGKHYYESTVTDDGLVRVGWSTKSGKNDQLGSCKFSFGFGGTGKKSHAGKFSDYGPNGGVSYVKGDTVGCLLDCDTGTITFTKNGMGIQSGDDSRAFSFDAKSFFLSKNKKDKIALFPAVCLKNAECELRFGIGSNKFKYPVPDGYRGIADADAAQWVSGDDENEDDEESHDDENDAENKQKQNGPRTPTALVLEPVRELAEQTCQFFTSFSNHLQDTRVTSALFVGGGGGVDGKKHQTELLTTGVGVDIAVGTPGRILDLVESGTLKLSKIRFLVLDEADALLDSGTLKTIQAIKQKIPVHNSITAKKFGRVQTLLFSATLRSPSIRRLATELCDRNATWVDLKGFDYVPDAVTYAVVEVKTEMVDMGKQSETNSITTDGVHDALPSHEKEKASLTMKRLKPVLVKRLVDSLSINKCLLFCRTNFDCENMKRFFDICNDLESTAVHSCVKYSCATLGGSLTNEERRVNLQKFKSNAVNFLICTDVAARGIDISNVPFLINVTLPDTADEYVHRVGRVGRAGAAGLAISLISTVPEKVWFVKKKGYKPWASAVITPEDRQQHTVYLDEMSTLRSIEDRLKEEIVRLDASSTDTLKRSAEKFAPATNADGTVISDAAKKQADEIAARLELYAPSTRRLVQLEVDAQKTFWNLKRKFAGV